MRLKKSGRGSVLSGLRLTSQKVGKITLKTSPRSLDGISVSKISGVYGSLQAQEVVENNYALLKVSIRPKRRFQLVVSSGKPILALLFNLSDEVQGLVNGNNETLTIFQYEHGLFYQPSLKAQVTLLPDKHYDLVLIAFDAEYLLRYRLDNLLREFFERVKAGESVQLISPRHFSSAIAEVLKGLFTPKKHFAPSMYREAKVLELLHSVIEDVTSCLVLYDPMPITDRISLQKLRRFLLKNFSKKMTVQELAIKFNLPAPFIDKKFKELNGISVHDFIEHERMRKAYLLVRDTKLSFAKIATLSGYKNAANFSWDFKKRFGESPSGVRSLAR